MRQSQKDQANPLRRDIDVQQSAIQRRKLSSDGAFYLFIRAIQRVLPRWVLHAQKFVITRSDMRLHCQPPEKFQDIRWGQLEELESFPVPGQDMSAAAALPDHDVDIVVAVRDGQVIGYEAFDGLKRNCQSDRVISISEDALGWLKLVLPSQDVWAYRSFVRPECRGQGVQKRLKYFADTHYANNEYRYHHGAIHAGNMVAFRAHASRDLDAFGHLMTVVFFGLKFVHLGKTTRIGAWSRKRPVHIPIELLAAPDGHSQ